MMRAGKKPNATDEMEGEFIPPIDVMQSEHLDWGVPWEDQLDVAQAWQAAGGNVDSEWDDWDGWVSELPVRSRNRRMPPVGDAANGTPTMATVVRMTTSLVSLRERLYRVQSETTEVARAEMRQRRALVADALDRSGQSAVRRPLGDENSRRILRLARDCVELLDAARAGMAGLSGMPAIDAAASPSFNDRRRNSMRIDFPDRRSAC